jgi:hypothetical protein
MMDGEEMITIAYNGNDDLLALSCVTHEQMEDENMDIEDDPSDISLQGRVLWLSKEMAIQLAREILGIWGAGTCTKAHAPEIRWPLEGQKL